MSFPWYTDAEIDDLCAGIRTNAAKARYLRGLGLTVNTKPNGRPLVIRTHAEAVLAGLQQMQATHGQPAEHGRARPNKEALMLLFPKKRVGV